MNALALFAGPYAWLARWAVIALLVAAFGAWAWVKGNAHGTQKLNDYIARQATEALRVGAARSRVTREVVTKYVRVRGATEVVTQRIEKEVVRYAQNNPGACLDADWRGLHDAAAANRVPDAGLGPDAEGRAPAAAARPGG
jgi:hypothetical protein